MKTDHTNARQKVSYSAKGWQTEEIKQKNAKETVKDKEPSYKQPTKKIEIQEPTTHPLEAVKQMVAEGIEWRLMRFYRHEAEGRYYVDIINKETGEVIRTVPEPEFLKIATQFKHLTGMNLDISG